jgi:hypothetical protein
LIFEILEDSANLPPSRCDCGGDSGGLRSCTSTVRRNSQRLEEVIARQLIRSFPLAHPLGFPSTSSIPMNSVVEDLQAALAQFAEIASDLKK